MGVKIVKKVKTEINLKPKPVITVMGDTGDLPYGSLLIGNQLINLKQAKTNEVLRAKVTKMNWTPGVVVPKEEYWRVKVVQRELGGLLKTDEKETAMVWRAKRREEMEAKRKAERAEQARKKAERRRKALERKAEEEAHVKAKMMVEAREKSERRLVIERKVEQTKLYIEKQRFMKERKEWRKGNRCICQEIGRPFDYRCIEHMLDREEDMAKVVEMDKFREVEAEERRKRLENAVDLAIERKVEDTRRYVQKQAEKKEMRVLQKGGKICMCKYGLQWDARCEQHAMEHTGRMMVKQKKEAKTREIIEKDEKKRALMKEKDDKKKIKVAEQEGRKRLLNQEKKDRKNIKIAQKREKMSSKVEKKESEKADDIGTCSENGMHLDDKCDVLTICDNVHGKNRQDNCKNNKTEKRLFNFAHSLRKAFGFHKK